MKTLPKNCPKTIFTYFIKLLTIVNIIIIIIIYYFILFSILILFYTYFYCTIEGANGHSFHYDYTLYDYMRQLNLNLIVLYHHSVVNISGRFLYKVVNTACECVNGPDPRSTGEPSLGTQYHPPLEL